MESRDLPKCAEDIPSIKQLMAAKCEEVDFMEEFLPRYPNQAQIEIRLVK